MKRRSLVVVAAVAMGACSGSATSDTTPTTTPTTTAPPAPGQPTVTITAAGVSPKQVEIAVGGRVTFVNTDTQVHEMYSDPHPVHTDCPPMNEVSVLTPGQSRQTGVFASPRTCGYHDHGQSTNTALQGSIVIR